MSYYDAHLHLQDPRLKPHLESTLQQWSQQGLRGCIVNGTSPDDWEQVIGLSKHPFIRPAIGLHPWKVTEADNSWFENLQTQLLNHPFPLIGEIGLDKWMRNPEFEKQISAFEQQLELAAAFDRTPTIHCLKAWGTLLETLRKHHLYLPGFLLHSYTGPIDMIDYFIEMGGYFSLSGYFANPEKVDKLEAWKRIPLHRILIETDAPDMLPPENLRIHNITDHQNNPLNSPINIQSTYQWAADFFEIEISAFQKQIETNFHRLFGRI